MNRSLAFYFFASVWLAMLQPLRADITTNLSAYWPFSQGSGTDATGNGFAVTLTNTTPANDRAGSASNALSFNGTTSSAEISTTFAMKNQQTVVAWIKPSAIGMGATYPILEKATSGFGGEIDFEMFLLPDGRISWDVNTDNGGTGSFVQALSTTFMQLNQWTLVVGVIDQASNQVRLYINGTLESTVSMGGRQVRNNNRPFRIGRRIGNQASQSFSGTIDDVRVYDRALTTADVLELQPPVTAPTSVPGFTPVLAEEFDGTALDTSLWSVVPGSLVGVSAGTLQLGHAVGSSSSTLSTAGQRVFTTDDLVVEWQANLGASYWMDIALTDGVNTIIAGDNAFGNDFGLRLKTTGIFNTATSANGIFVGAADKVYRLTVSQNSIRLQRGDSLQTLYEEVSLPLPGTARSLPLSLQINSYWRYASVSWIRVLQATNVSQQTMSRYGDGRHGSFTVNSPMTVEELYSAVRLPTDPVGYCPKDVFGIPDFNNLTIANGGSLTCSSWNGGNGGNITFKVRGRLFVATGGSINASATGYASGQGPGGGGNGGTWYNGGYGIGGAYGGGGAGFGEQGSGGGYMTNNGSYTGGSGGPTYGTAYLNAQEMGSGGGASGASDLGGRGGGNITISAGMVSVSGPISANGANGSFSNAGGGGGSGGGIKIQSISANLGMDNLSASGGVGGNGGANYNTQPSQYGGNGGVGRIRVELSTVVNFTSNPSASTVVDSSADQDGDGIPDFVELGPNPEALRDADADGIFDYMEADSDNDGIPDAIERGTNGLIPLDSNGDGTPDYASLDSDADGVLDAIESGPNGIFPKDTDGDGLPDFADADSDNNGIPDSIELLPNGLTRTADTDGDTIPDYWEQVYGLNPNSAADALSHPPGDQFTYLEKYRLNLRGNTPDFDGDGVSDYVEQLTSGTSATKTDTDGDSMPDAWELAHGLNPLINDKGGDLDGDGLTNLQEYNGGVASTNPGNRDSDGNGVSDYEQRNGTKFIRHVTDRNDRHVTTFYDNGAWEGWRYDGNGNIIRHVLTIIRDKDGDGLEDAFELANGLDFNNSAGTQGFSGDADGDGWTNHQEYLASTNPNDASSHPESVSSAGMVWFNAPKARVITPPGSGGALATINVRVWDAEANPAKLVLQWWDAATSTWKPATVSKVDGGDPSAANALATSPGGTAHQFLWNAIADVPAVNGIVLLRVTAQDPAGTTTSEALPFALNTTGPHLVIEEPTGTPLTNVLSTTDFGTVNVGSTLTKTYTLRNIGSAALISLALNKSGAAAANYALGSLGNTLASGASTTFTLGFTPSTGGTRAATLSIASSDAAEGNFVIALTGNGLPLPIPSFITQPQSQIVFVGTAVNFTVANAVGSSPTLSWSKNTTAIPSSNVNPYSIALAQLTDAATYSVAATNSTSTVNSNAASLAVVAPTAVTSKSQNEGTTLTLTCSAAGPGITYVWQRNGTDLGNMGRISGANTPALTITGLNAGDAGSYACLVKLGALSLSHGNTTLTVALKPVVLTTSIAVAHVSENIDFTFTAANTPTSWTIAGLPKGITLDATAGRITGKPTVAKDPYPLTVTAINAIGSSAVMSIPWRVLALENQSVGTFNGLVDRDGGVNGGLGGSITVTTLATGDLSGSLVLAGVKLPFKGVLNTSGLNSTAQISVARTPATLGPLALEFSIAAGDGVLTGSVTDAKLTPFDMAAFAGTEGTSGSDNGTGIAASFSAPHGIAADSLGNVFVADTANHLIRKITVAGVVTTLAGTDGVAGSTNANGTSALFSSPEGVAVDAIFNVYVADTGNHTVRKISPAGDVTTLAGSAGLSGSLNGTGSAARLVSPVALVVDKAGTVFVADEGNHTLRKVTAAGATTTLAGKAGTAGSTNGTGSAARFNAPQGIAIDGKGMLYVADTGNSIIRKITAAGAVSTLAGSPLVTGTDDGLAANARFDHPRGIAVDAEGNVLVAETVNQTLRRVSIAGRVSTLAEDLDTTESLAMDMSGNVFASDSALHLIRQGTATPAMPVSLTAQRMKWSTKTPADAGLVGRFHTAIKPPADLAGLATYPQGTGYAVITTTTTGSSAWLGKLSDGTTLTVSMPLGPNGEMGLHTMLYTNTGSIQGWPQIDGSDSSVSGTSKWMKIPEPAASASKLYKSGIPLHELTLQGGRYTTPANLPMLLALQNKTPNARLRFSADRSIDFLTHTLNISPSNAFLLTSPNGSTVKLVLTPSTGLFSGSFIKTGVTATYYGLIVPVVGSEEGIGFYTLPGGKGPTLLSGQVVLDAVP